MAEPIAFPSTTTNFSLPLLFSGQAQKEFSLNQALTVIDAMMLGTVEQSLASPPSSPGDGSSYRILANPDGEWTGHDDEIALWIGGSWHFVQASDGMAIFDQTASQCFRFLGGWSAAVEPTIPNGGSVVDAEARAALVEIVEALRTYGIV